MQIGQRFPAASVVALLLTLLSSTASAATMYYLDVEGLVEASDFVVVGEIVDADVFVGNEDRITTEWTLRVDALVVGQAAAEIRFRQWAGELNGQVQHVPGDARLELGDRGVFFLRGDGEQNFLTALAQSVFFLHEDAIDPNGGIVGVPSTLLPMLEVDGRFVEVLPLNTPVSRDMEEIVLFERTDRGPAVVDAGREAYTLGILLSQVRAAVEVSR